jgi:hypothetical protein
MGGSLSAFSAGVDCGATFTLELPLKQQVASNATETTITEKAAA